MGLFSKKPAQDVGQYHIPIEVALMNFHDAHLGIVAHFRSSASAYCEAEGETLASVHNALTETMAISEELEIQIRAKLRDDASFVRYEAVKNGMAGYYDDYVSTRISMFRFAISYRVMNAYVAFCNDHGIEMSD